MIKPVENLHQNIIHIQKRPAKSYHEAILLSAIEKSIDYIIETCEIPRAETITVRLVAGDTMERVLCVTNDDRVFSLLNDPEHQESKDSHYHRFYRDFQEIFCIINLTEASDEFPLKKDFIQFGYKSKILLKMEHVGVIAIYSELDATQRENRIMVKNRVAEFQNMVMEKIHAASEAKLVGLYQEIKILTTLAQKDEEKAFHQILEFVGRHHSVYRTAIFGINSSNESYNLLAGYPKGTHGKDKGFLSNHPLLKIIVETKTGLHVTELKKDPRTRWLTAPGGIVDRHGITEIAGFPIFLNGEIKAVMTADYAKKKLQFNPVIDQTFFNSVCDIISNLLSIISEVKQVRLEEDIRRIVDHFLHEIRNPITSSAGFARRNFNFLQKHGQEFHDPTLFIQKFRNEEGIEDRKEFADFFSNFSRNTSIIINESSRVEEILNEFETFVKLKRGMVKIVREPIDLNELGNYFEKLFQGLKFSISQDLKGCHLYLDKARLNQVLFNLIKNAYEHAYGMNFRSIVQQEDSFFSKKIFLRIFIEETNIFIDIINEGQISKEIQTQIFEPYFTCGHHDGSGLGLTISLELVKLMNGNVSFENISLEGENFVRFRLVFSCH